ncbi:hypothetical protein LOD99_4871 [Oopsacas minuta]|uniref:Uncharacterized protein n=1 Tax=Oopsacas minuta TaxID=111878 RepID=A0AAV7JTA5_9METZ|nr:hypothetical protein LOD99_4871 [Oopsacas minuta]
MSEIVTGDDHIQGNKQKEVAEGGEDKNEVIMQKKRKRVFRKRVPPKISNLDLNSGQHRYVTVDSFTVLITEYKEKENESGDSD